MRERRAQVLEAEEVGVQPAAAYFVAPGLGHHRPAEAGEQRAYHEYAAAQRRTLAYELVALKVVEVDVAGAEGVFVLALALHADAHVYEQLYEVLHVEDVGYVLYPHLVAGQQRGANHLQGLVLRALRRYGAAQRVSAFDYERFHWPMVCLLAYLLPVISLAPLLSRLFHAADAELECVEVKLDFAVGEARQV